MAADDALATTSAANHDSNGSFFTGTAEEDDDDEEDNKDEHYFMTQEEDTKFQPAFLTQPGDNDLQDDDDDEEESSLNHTGPTDLTTTDKSSYFTCLSPPLLVGAAATNTASSYTTPASRANHASDVDDNVDQDGFSRIFPPSDHVNETIDDSPATPLHSPSAFFTQFSPSMEHSVDSSRDGMHRIENTDNNNSNLLRTPPTFPHPFQGTSQQQQVQQHDDDDGSTTAVPTRFREECAHNDVLPCRDREQSVYLAGHDMAGVESKETKSNNGLTGQHLGPSSSRPPSTEKDKTMVDDDDESDDDDDDEDGDSQHDDNHGDHERTPLSTVETPIQERRKRNTLRHEQMLAELFSRNMADNQGGKRKGSKRRGLVLADDEQQHDCDDTILNVIPQKRGSMVRPTLYNGLSGFKTTEDEEEDLVQRLQRRFPHRQSQIETLVSLLRSSMVHAGKSRTNNSQEDVETTFIPPPILVTGPSGTGKTAIVQQVVLALIKHCNAPIANAYINCATVCSAQPINAITEEIFHKLVPPSSMAKAKKPMPHTKKRRRTLPPAGDKQGIQDSQRTTDEQLAINTTTGPDNLDSRLATEPEETRATTIEDIPPNAVETEADNSSNKEKVRTLCVATLDGSSLAPSIDQRMVTTKVGTSQESEEVFALDHTIATAEDENEGDLEDRIERTRAKAGKESTSDTFTEHIGNTYKGPTRAVRASTSAQTMIGDQTGSANVIATESRSLSHAAVVDLGRSLRRYWKHQREGQCGILVLDHAERLLSTTKKGLTVERNNFLVQLLLLPRVFLLNITVVAITNSGLLCYSAANNLLTSKSSVGTIAKLVQPISIHFSAYRTPAEFKDILKVPHMQALMLGESADEVGTNSTKFKFRQAFVDSFTETLVQSVVSCTRDLREIIRMGRSLWTVYLEPVGVDRIDQTLLSIRAAESASNVPAIQAKLTMFLTAKILPHIRSALDRMFLLTDICPFREHAFETSSNGVPDGVKHDRRRGCHNSDLPYLSKCLLLAAYICQHNNPDQDSHLFTAQGSGKRKRKTSRAAESQPQLQSAFGSTTNDQQQLKMLRPRTVLLERMLSVFVSLVGLHQTSSQSVLPSATDGGSDLVSQLGNQPFFDSLVHLRDLGLIQEGSAGKAAFSDSINMTSPRYWTTLTLHEAESVAASIHFPLSKYLRSS